MLSWREAMIVSTYFPITAIQGWGAPIREWSCPPTARRNRMPRTARVTADPAEGMLAPVTAPRKEKTGNGRSGSRLREPRGAAEDGPQAAAPDLQDTSPGGWGQPFPIVGIGASAGGLAALQGFLSGMPTDRTPGMAFILVQHLAPNHDSVLTEILQRHTRLAVSEATDGMLVEPDHVYIIPPNRDMTLRDGALQLLEPVAPRGHRLPIDHFFRSLAQDRGERAICIVLSGTGSDGVLGLRAIKGAGGLVVVQTLDSAQYDGMPRSALNTGLVDYELPVEQMIPQLISYCARAFGPDGAEPHRPLPDAPLHKLFVLLRAQTGHDLSGYKPTTVRRRVERRMAVHQVDTLPDYVELAEAMPAELDVLFRDLLIGVTSFFRDADAFEALGETVIDPMLAARPDGAPVRVWVPGCSTGEEAYSIAILLAEAQQRLRKPLRLQVFATDIDSRAIETARAGVYPASIAADIDPERLRRFFSPEPEPSGAGASAYRINKSVRDMLVFSEHDIIQDPPFSRLDLISCRNLLIYMGARLQKRIIPMFHYALAPGGCLLLGTSETTGEFGDLFEPVDRTQKVYRRKEGPAHAVRASLRSFPSPIAPAAAVSPMPSGPPDVVESISLKDFARDALLQHCVPAAVLVTARGDVLYIHGRTGMYLEPAPGEAEPNNVLKMAREGLRRDLAIALHRASTTGTVVHARGLSVRTNGSTTAVDLAVHPVEPPHGGESEQPVCLVVLRPATAPASPDAAGATPAAAPPHAELQSRIEALEHQLIAKEEYLQTTTEELESSNEDLKAANEELQSVNEELQSSNEELETSKEELQSVNEELSTVNAELEHKVVDLTRMNNDMNNLLAGTGIATVFVDTQLRILRFTPAATKIINLLASDVGRPIGHIASNLKGYGTLVSDAQGVLDTLVPVTREVRTHTDRCYSMRILPYRTLDNTIDGVVITFVDDTEARELHDALDTHAERMRVALAATSVIVFNQDRELRYTWLQSAEPDFDAASVIGRNDAELFPPEEAAALQAMKRAVLESGVGTRGRVTMTMGGSPRAMDLTVEPLLDSEAQIVGITGAALMVMAQGSP